MVEGRRRFLPRAARGTMRSMVEGACARPALSDADFWGKIRIKSGVCRSYAPGSRERRAVGPKPGGDPGEAHRVARTR
jgi:hypothetical protein